MWLWVATKTAMPFHGTRTQDFRLNVCFIFKKWAVATVVIALKYVPPTGPRSKLFLLCVRANWMLKFAPFTRACHLKSSKWENYPVGLRCILRFPRIIHRKRFNLIFNCILWIVIANAYDCDKNFTTFKSVNTKQW